jgi:hypothetical protein
MVLSHESHGSMADRPRAHLPPEVHLGEAQLGEAHLGDFHLGEFHLGEFHLGEFHLGEFHLGEFHLGEGVTAAGNPCHQILSMAFAP